MLHKTARAAVFASLDELKDRTSVEVLMIHADSHCRREVSYHAAVIYRSKWRKINGIRHDSRTHETQHRRNMLNDDKWTSKAWKAMIKAAHGQVKSAEVLPWVIELTREFHSIDQLREMLSDLLAARQAA